MWCEELFENEHVRLLFLFKVSLFGTWLTDTLSKTSPMGSVIRAFDLQTGYQLCQGGSFNLARGLMETFIAAGGTLPAAGRDRPHRDRRWSRHRHRARGRPHGARAQFVASHHRCASDIREHDRPRAIAGDVRRKLDGFKYTAWTLFGLHLALHESPRFAAASFDPNIDRALKWSIGAETMEDLFAAHSDVQAGRVPKLVQFGSGPLSLLDPDAGAARQAHDLCLACDAAQSRHRRPGLRGVQGGVLGQDHRDLCALLSEHDQQEYHRRSTSTRRANIRRNCVNMRGGDIFMGAFNAEQVMYNHFGYRTPIANLYYAGSAGASAVARFPAGRAISPPASSRAISD